MILVLSIIYVLLKCKILQEYRSKEKILFILKCNNKIELHNYHLLYFVEGFRHLLILKDMESSELHVCNIQQKLAILYPVFHRRKYNNAVQRQENYLFTPMATESIYDCHGEYGHEFQMALIHAMTMEARSFMALMPQVLQLQLTKVSPNPFFYA